jgi:hypothetical protein
LNFEKVLLAFDNQVLPFDKGVVAFVKGVLGFEAPLESRFLPKNASSNPARANEFFVGRLQCQNNMKLVFRISEDGSETFHTYLVALKILSSLTQRKTLMPTGGRPVSSVMASSSKLPRTT